MRLVRHVVFSGTGSEFGRLFRDAMLKDAGGKLDFDSTVPGLEPLEDAMGEIEDVSVDVAVAVRVALGL